MPKADRFGMECQAFKPILILPVFSVADNRMPLIRQMHTDLILPPSQKIDLQQTERPLLFKDLVRRTRRFPPTWRARIRLM